MKSLGKIGRIVDGRLVIVAHVVGKYIMEVTPYKATKVNVTKKCPGILCALIAG